jgi:hypothetical protein
VLHCRSRSAVDGWVLTGGRTLCRAVPYSGHLFVLIILFRVFDTWIFFLAACPSTQVLHSLFLQWMQEDDELSESGNDLLDPDAPRQQKHAKSPELARDFLLDAATVIFKEQVGGSLFTARQT